MINYIPDINLKKILAINDVMQFVIDYMIFHNIL